MPIMRKFLHLVGLRQERISLPNLGKSSPTVINAYRKSFRLIDNIRFSKKDSLDYSLASKSPTAIREELTFNVRDARNSKQGKNLLMMRRNS